MMTQAEWDEQDRQYAADSAAEFAATVTAVTQMAEVTAGLLDRHGYDASDEITNLRDIAGFTVTNPQSGRRFTVAVSPVRDDQSESAEDREARHRALAVRRADRAAQEQAEQALTDRARKNR
jgi:hypothetical protein